jgi:hypothetical protein
VRRDGDEGEAKGYIRGVIPPPTVYAPLVSRHVKERVVQGLEAAGEGIDDVYPVCVIRNCYFQCHLHYEVLVGGQAGGAGRQREPVGRQGRQGEARGGEGDKARKAGEVRGGKDRGGKGDREKQGGREGNGNQGRPGEGEAGEQGEAGIARGGQRRGKSGTLLPQRGRGDMRAGGTAGSQVHQLDELVDGNSSGNRFRREEGRDEGGSEDD